MDIQERAIDDFNVFVKEIFSLSVDILKDGIWVGGDFVDEITTWYGSNTHTVRVSARDHMKSMSFYAHVMWKIYRMQYIGRSREAQYFSYIESMARYHLSKIKRAIQSNPFFNDIIDLTHDAVGAIRYTWVSDQEMFEKKKRKRAEYVCQPRGLMQFKRGVHSQDVYVDDPFQDPDNLLLPLKILKINNIMKMQILDMAQSELHIAGTAQTNHDFYFDKAFTSRFSVRIDPAEKDTKNKIPLWEEWMNWEELQAKKIERGERVYNQEYLCKPVYMENAFIKMDRLLTVVNPQLKNHDFNSWNKEIQRRKQNKEETQNNRFGGWDLGKKGHPAHFTIFEEVGDKWVQLLERWFDEVDYTAQLEFINEAIEVFELDKVYFDATRGEMDVLMEDGTLSSTYEPIHFTLKKKTAMAGVFDRKVTDKSIELINSERQLNQMCLVNNDLQAPTTKDGHADSFWSTCLCMNAVLDGNIEIFVL